VIAVLLVGVGVFFLVKHFRAKDKGFNAYVEMGSETL
jgi:hypothetical protein